MTSRYFWIARKCIESVAVVVLGLSSVGCHNPVFTAPNRASGNTPGDYGFPFENLWIVPEPGTRIHAWLLAGFGERKGAVLGLHSSQDTLEDSLAALSWMTGAGYDVMLIDYRGYGQSEGARSLTGFVSDVRASLEYLRSRPGTQFGHLVVIGEELGAALAVSVVSGLVNQSDIELLVLDSLPGSYRELVAENMSDPDVRKFMQTMASVFVESEVDPIKRMELLYGVPVLVLQGSEEQRVNREQAVELFSRVSGPHEMWQYDGAGLADAFKSVSKRQDLLDLIAALKR